jgi:hypothetical protein
MLIEKKLKIRVNPFNPHNPRAKNTKKKLSKKTAYLHYDSQLLQVTKLATSSLDTL